MTWPAQILALLLADHQQFVLFFIKTVSSTLVWLLLRVWLSHSYYWILPFFCIRGLFQYTAAVLCYTCPKTWVTREKSYPSRCLSTVFFHFFFPHKITFFLPLINFPKGTGTFSLLIWKLKLHHKWNIAGRNRAPLYSVFSCSFSGIYTADARLIAGLRVLLLLATKDAAPSLCCLWHPTMIPDRCGVFFSLPAKYCKHYVLEKGSLTLRLASKLLWLST